MYHNNVLCVRKIKRETRTLECTRSLIKPLFSPMIPSLCQTTFFRKRSEKPCFWWRLERKTAPTPGKVWAKLSHRLWRRIIRCKIGFCDGWWESINVIYINPKWRRVGNTDVRFTHIVEMIYARLYRAIHQQNLHSFFLYVTTRLSVLSRLCRHACQCISLGRNASKQRRHVYRNKCNARPNVCGANGTYTRGSSYQIAIHITGCNYSTYPPFSLYMHMQVEL